MKKIPVMLVAGAIVFMLSSCGQAKDAEEGQADTVNNIWESSTKTDETDSNEMDSDEMDSDGKEDTAYDVLDSLTGEYEYLSDYGNGIGRLLIEKTTDGYDIFDFESEYAYRFLANSSNIERIEDNKIVIKYPEQVLSDDTVIFSYYVLEYSADEINVYYGKTIEEVTFLYHAAKKSESGAKPEQSGNFAEDIAGWYVCPVDDSTLSIVADVDHSYRAELDLFRLTGIDDLTGKYEDGILTMTGTDAAGNPITTEITFYSGGAILTFTDSTWEYLKNGTRYVFNKEAEGAESNVQAGENTDSAMTSEELLDLFINGTISAADSENPTATFYITDLDMDSGEWDSFSVGERVDLDNDGENELIICGPYGGIYLDARDNKVYEFARGDGTGLTLSYVVYNGATWIMYSSRMKAEYEAYYMKKFEGADYLAAEINFGEEAVDTNNIESGRKYTWNGTETSYEEYTALAGKILATEVYTN